jgi:HAE1 family hydrophobic/amphiphilic exporter-1
MELHVVRRLEQAADVGVTTDEMGYTVDALIDGAYATDYYVGGTELEQGTAGKDNEGYLVVGDKIDLIIVGSDEFARHTQDLGELPVATSSGDLVRLQGLAEIAFQRGPEQINRRERQRAITILVTPPPAMPLEQAIDAIRNEIVEPMTEQGKIGGEYQITLAGTADKLLATWRALRWNFLLALLVTYLLMAALFESWLYPLVIILSVPLGAVGGLIGLWFLNAYLSLLPYPQFQLLDVLTMLGFVILIGTVVNNPILIVHQSLNHMRDEGMGPREAILESVRTRIRPIFMTTLTTVFGLSPLVFFPGTGSELYRGLGAVVLGGLVVSTAFTLILVPTLFSLMMDAKTTVGRLLLGKSETAVVAVSSKPEEVVAAG